MCREPKGPIRRAACFERRCLTTFAQPQMTVVMGPCVRRDDKRGFNFSNNSRHTFAFSQRIAPEVCSKIPALSKMRAQGMPGARCARGLVCNDSVRCAHEHTGHTGIARHSPRNGLRLITCSPRRPGFLPPSSARLSANLTPASGCRAHTSSPSARKRCRLKHPSRPPQPAPRT